MAEDKPQLSSDSANDGVAQSPQGKSASRQLEAGYYSVVGCPTADGRVVIGEDVEIFPGRECADFASPETHAYEAKDRRLTGDQFALICGRNAIPRVTSIGSYRGLKNPHILKLAGAGIVQWPLDGCQKFALVYERPQGKKLLSAADAKPYRLAEDKLVSGLIVSVVSALTDLKNIDLVHGAINAENIYLTGAEGFESVILGECLSNPPSWRQHPLYEIPARATAQAAGRGPGTIREDLYALGMCVAMAARGENFLLGKSLEQIIHEKIEHGSYGAIVGRERLPSGVSEFLRGVLNDDEKQRWSLEDVQRWLEGRRAPPKQSRVILKAARPLIFREQKYWDLRSVAVAFSEHIPEAAAELEKGQFESWLKRNFEDKPLQARLDDVWQKEKSASRERLISSICMAMDPFGPLRYKNISIFPAGMGNALARAMANGEDMQVYGETILQRLTSKWISQIFDDVPDAAGLITLFEKCRNALTQKMPGYGIERVLYMLNPEVICMSPHLRDYFVLVPGGVLLALEELSKKAGRPDVLLDRHMIAFISVREPKMIDPHLGYVNSSSKGNQLVGVIRTLAAIQRRFSTGLTPGVGNWLISQTGPVVEMLRDQDLRQELSRAIARLQDSGNLTALLDLVDDSQLLHEDMQRFSRARQEYKRLEAEKGEISNSLRKQKSFGRATGRHVAMMASAVLAAIAIAAYLVLRLSKGII